MGYAEFSREKIFRALHGRRRRMDNRWVEAMRRDGLFIEQAYRYF
jgi:hypothetical protein